ncbi:hypothetical protein Tco_0015260 [Tanacetum coccineum]
MNIRLLDGVSWFFPNPIDPVIKDKIDTFTCPYGTFANVSSCLSACLMQCSQARIHVVVLAHLSCGHGLSDYFDGRAIGSLYDDLLCLWEILSKTASPVFRPHASKVSKGTNFSIILGGEEKKGKSHFMVKEGIVLAIRFAKKGIEVLKSSKIDLSFAKKITHTRPLVNTEFREFSRCNGGLFTGVVRFRDFSKISADQYDQRPISLRRKTPFLFPMTAIRVLQYIEVRTYGMLDFLIASKWDLSI